MKIILVCFIALIALIFNLSSCKHDPIAPIVPTNEICFQGDILPVLQSNCAKSGCHDASGRGGIRLTDYDNVLKIVKAGDPSNSDLYTVLLSGSNMPPSPNTALTTKQIELIYDWIAQGAKNTTCTSGCDTNVFTFSGAVLPIVQQFCTGCHSGGSPSGGLSLQNYAEVVSAVDNENLYARVTSSSDPMPPSGLMEACKIRQIKKWIDNGKLNN